MMSANRQKSPAVTDEIRGRRVATRKRLTTTPVALNDALHSVCLLCKPGDRQAALCTMAFVCQVQCTMAAHNCRWSMIDSLFEWFGEYVEVCLDNLVTFSCLATRARHAVRNLLRVTDASDHPGCVRGSLCRPARLLMTLQDLPQGDARLIPSEAMDYSCMSIHCGPAMHHVQDFASFHLCS